VDDLSYTINLSLTDQDGVELQRVSMVVPEVINIREGADSVVSNFKSLLDIAAVKLLETEAVTQ